MENVDTEDLVDVLANSHLTYEFVKFSIFCSIILSVQNYGKLEPCVFSIRHGLAHCSTSFVNGVNNSLFFVLTITI